MPVDLRALPEKRVLPTRPYLGRWCLVVLLCAVLGAGLVILLWPQDLRQMPLWYWCCLLVFPAMTGLLLFALRRLIYERQHDFAQSWNLSRGELEQALIQKGQRSIAVLATSYCTAAGNNQLARALRGGSKPLQPIYLADLATTMRLSQLAPVPKLYTEQEYMKRLTSHVHQVVRGLDEDLQRFADTTPVYVRIRHNQDVSDEKILSLWRECIGDALVVDQVVLASQDDGLLWLDTWLDEPSPCPLLLSLEINLFQQPAAEQAESVSVLLLAQPEWCARENVVPTSWVHRPVPMTGKPESLQDMFLWGGVQEDSTPLFAWQTQVPTGHLCEVNMALSAAGHPLELERCQPLDNLLGLPGCAVGNLTLVVASEHASAERQTQLVMMQDASPQWCVVRPAG
ncbi:hypothetical protein [Pseudomonas umsongensis]|uniref:hypothetical protein n=1 Tax=Pseudomonas umsongensis TaxID=198618 RepID=UPI0015C0646B|nr:hypothetical protein [Pseudomonas umsongensis]NWL22243.1 hypothetical protein [Pseudomonas umsongensis]